MSSIKLAKLAKSGRAAALEWDGVEARFVVVESQRGQPRLCAAEALRWEHAPAAETAAEPPSANELWEARARQLRAALAMHNVGRAPVAVNLDRASIESLQLVLPPARDVELPELVRNAALRESSSLTDETIIDFTPLDDDTSAPRRVAAVCIDEQSLESVKSFCRAAGVQVRHAALRPHGVAAVWRRADRGAQPTLLVSRAGGDLDLALVAGERLMAWRTVRLPESADPAERTARIVAEIGRTLVVFAGEPGAKPIGRVALVGAADEFGAAGARLAERHGVAVDALDPFAGLDGAPLGLAETSPFASLIGLAGDVASGQRPPIDLIEPRRQRPPPNRRRSAYVAAAGAIVVVAAIVGWVWSAFDDADREIAALDERLRAAQKLSKKAAEQQRIATAIDDWVGRDVNWLDELRDFSDRFPSARDAVVLRMTMSSGRDGGGVIDLQGLVRAPTIVSRIEESFRDDFHQLQNKRLQEKRQDASYTWQFDGTLAVEARDKAQFQQRFAESAAAPESLLPAAGKPANRAADKAAEEAPQ